MTGLRPQDFWASSMVCIEALSSAYDENLAILVSFSAVLAYYVPCGLSFYARLTDSSVAQAVVNLITVLGAEESWIASFASESTH